MDIEREKLREDSKEGGLGIWNGVSLFTGSLSTSGDPSS